MSCSSLRGHCGSDGVVLQQMWGPEGDGGGAAAEGQEEGRVPAGLVMPNGL